ncbi:Methylated-DNA--protein-cysteine methyltransferase, inducible [Streptomyces glaucescens]
MVRDDSAAGRRARSARPSQQLAAYFAGDLKDFRAAPLRATGTPFRETGLGRPRRRPLRGDRDLRRDRPRGSARPRAAVRAVGGAIGANPLLIVRPCHRVIGADGALTGYAGGLDRKIRLLTLEGVRSGGRQTPSSSAGQTGV